MPPSTGKISDSFTESIDQSDMARPTPGMTRLAYVASSSRVR